MFIGLRSLWSLMRKLALITITILTTLALLLLLWQLRSVIAILVIAIVLATTLTGFVKLLEARGWPRQRAIVTVILGTLLFIGSFLALTVYVLGDRLPFALRDFRTIYGELRAGLLAGNSAQRTFAARLPPPALLDDLWLGPDGAGLLTLAFGLSANVGALISNLVLVIFVALYWVADRERIERLWLSLLPPTRRPRARHLLYRIEDEIGTHLRSKLVQDVVALVLLMVGYALIGLKYPFLLAWTAAVMWFVPLIGGVLALLPATLLGLIDGYGTMLAVIVYTVIVLIGVRRLIDRVPTLRQRPGSILELMITIALIDVMGIVGLFIAAPVAITLQIIFNSWFLATAAAPAAPVPVDIHSFVDKVTTLQAQITADDAEISPRTHNLYERLSELVDAVKTTESQAP
jgi:predicted PurR-regulated permease PerM